MKRLARYYLYILLLLSPLPAAMNRDWMTSFALGTTLIICALIMIWHGFTRYETLLGSGVIIGALLAMGFLAYSLAQILVGAQFIGSIDAASVSIQHVFEDQVISEYQLVPMVLDIGSAYSKLSIVTTCFLIFFLAVYVSSRTRYAMALSYVALFAGAIQIAIGLFEYFFGVDVVLFSTTTGPNTNGTFINRNHYSGYVLMTASLAVGLLFSTGLDGRHRGRSGVLRRIGDQVAALFHGRSLVLLGFLLASLVVVGTTGSRGPLVAFFTALFCVAMAQSVIAKSGKTLLGSILILILLFTAALLTLGGSESISRIERLIENDYQIQRLKEWGMGFALFLERPLFGFGLGSIQDAFQAARDGSLSSNKTFQHVHSQYLETLIETGIVGFALFGLFIAWAVRVVVRGIRNSVSESSQQLLTGVLLLAATALLQAIFDFSFNIPAIAFLFHAILGTGVGLVLNGATSRRHRSRFAVSTSSTNALL